MAGELLQELNYGVFEVADLLVVFVENGGFDRVWNIGNSGIAEGLVVFGGGCVDRSQAGLFVVAQGFAELFEVGDDLAEVEGGGAGLAVEGKDFGVVGGLGVGSVEVFGLDCGAEAVVEGEVGVVAGGGVALVAEGFGYFGGGGAANEAEVATFEAAHAFLVANFVDE